MRVYVAGPMRGIKDFNFPAFDEAAMQLRSCGHVVFSPAERDRDKLGDVFRSATGDEKEIKQFSLREALGADTAWIAEFADAVVLLPGWERSLGAQAEAALARALGLPTEPIEAFLERVLIPGD